METDSSLLQRVIVRFAAGAFVVELLLAELSLRIFRGRDLSNVLLNGHNLGPSIVAGLVLAVVVAALSRLLFATYARDLTRELFVPIFRGMSISGIAAVSILPGIGEELLFRAVLQTAIGILPASIVFGLLHSGFSRRLLLYGLWAVVVGILLGATYQWTGNLWGSIVAHSIINAAGGLWLRHGGAPEGPTDTGEG